MKKLLVVVMVIAIALVSSVAMASIVSTKHNLSSGGTGSYTSNTSEICVFCHTPHNADVTKGPLWNRSAIDRTYAMYSIQTPSGQTLTSNALSTASKGCMSCHDGGTALASILNQPGGTGGVAVTVNNSAATLLSGYANVGGGSNTDLSNDHPVTVQYDTARASLRGLTINTSAVTKISGTNTVNGSATSRVYCESCHDVHGVTGVASFLRMTNVSSQLCLACHQK
jgi:predicted CXXCH cytochrome family protein